MNTCVNAKKMPAGSLIRAAMQFHELPDGKRIAYNFTPGSEPTLVFLPGYMSDMAGSKAQAVYAWAEAENRACLLLDYSGCGESEGQFADGSLSQWRDEVLALISAHCSGQVMLIGSSMGGWLMLLVGLSLGNKLAGLIGIAAAPDFTTWGFTDAQKAELTAGKTIYEANPYGPEPTPTRAKFWADGQQNLLLDSPIPITCPVRLLHGQNDTIVPPDISLKLASALRSDDVQVTLVKHGDHRLSRDTDIALLLRTIAALKQD